MIAATLFSGIGAPECAMPHWDWRWHAEIEKFPSAVMAARHPRSVNLGDVNAEDFVERAERIGRPDVLVFGSPCQDFSVAGQRVGLDGDRGNLALVALGIAAKLRPRWVVFENVPGLLSSRSGSAAAERALRDRGVRGDAGVGDGADAEEDSDFAAFLALVQQCGYFGAYRIVDAQFAGVPQRRRRIFAVFHLGDWRPAAAVLFEPESLRGDHPPSREARERVAGTISARTEGGGGLGTDFDLSGGLVESSGQRAPGLRVPGVRGGERRDVVADVRVVRGGADGPAGTVTSSLARCSADEAERGTLVAGALSASTGEASQQDAERGLLVAGTLTARQARTRGAGQADANLVAYGGNNTSGPISQATAVRAKGGSGHGDFESETFVLEEPVSFDCKAGGDTSFAVGDKAGALRASHGGGHSAVLAFEDRSRGDDGRGYAREPNFVEDASPALNTVKPPTIAFSCKDWGGDATPDQSPTLRAMEFGDSHANGGGQVAIAFQTRVARNGRGGASDVVPALNGADAGATSDMRPCVAVFKPSHYTRDKDSGPSDVMPPLTADADKSDQDPVLFTGAAVRRLTPRECERLQAYEDDYTLIEFRGKPAADGPRYKALGNSMHIGDIRWVLERIEKFEREILR